MSKTSSRSKPAKIEQTGNLWKPPHLRDVSTAKPALKVPTYDLAFAFPDVPSGLRPFGSRVVVQVRRSRTHTAGGIELTGDTQDTEKWNTVVAKVIAMGPLAFHNRDTLQPWPEGNWCSVGDFVWTPQFAGQRHERKTRDGGSVHFRLINDLDLLGDCTIDPLDVIAFI